MAVKSGKLRHRIEIQVSTTTADDASNEPIDHWQLFRMQWAGIDPSDGTERYGADQVQGTVSHVMTVRSVQGITNKMRVKFRGRVFGILAVLNIEERGAEGRLLCMEKTVAQ